MYDTCFSTLASHRRFVQNLLVISVFCKSSINLSLQDFLGLLLPFLELTVLVAVFCCRPFIARSLYCFVFPRMNSSVFPFLFSVLSPYCGSYLSMWLTLSCVAICEAQPLSFHVSAPHCRRSVHDTECYKVICHVRMFVCQHFHDLNLCNWSDLSIVLDDPLQGILLPVCFPFCHM